MIEQGYYVGRFIRRGTRWHLVESKVTDRYITRCGRQMREELPKRGPVQFAEVEGGLRDIGLVEDVCRQCYPQEERN